MPHRVIASLLFIPGSGSGEPHCREAARWVLPCPRPGSVLGGGRPSQREPGDTLTCCRLVHSIASGASAPPLLNLFRGFRAAAPGGAAARLSWSREDGGVPNTSAPAPPRALSGAELPPLPSGRPHPAPPPPSSSLLLSEPRRLLPGRTQPREPSSCAAAACEVAGSRPSDRQPGEGTGSYLAPPERGGRGRAAAPRAGAERLRLGPASGGSHALAAGGAAPRPGAGPWPPEARGAPSGCGADTGWVERSRAAAGGAGRPAAPTREWASPGGGV